MDYPPRLSHLATRKILVAKLAPTYAASHAIDEEEAGLRLEAALTQRLIEQLLSACWTALKGSTKRLKEDALLEKVARSLAERPMRPGRAVEATPELAAFLVLLDVEAGYASDAARRLLETDDGRRRTDAGLLEAGRLLAKELTR